MAYTFRLKPNQEAVPNNEKEVDVYEHVEMELVSGGTATVLEYKTMVTLNSIVDRIALEEARAVEHTAKAARLKTQRTALIAWWQSL